MIRPQRSFASPFPVIISSSRNLTFFPPRLHKRKTYQMNEIESKKTKTVFSNRKPYTVLT